MSGTEFSRPTNGSGEDEHQEGHPHAHSSLLTCSFNQDGGCLAIGTTSGFSVHNLHPQYAVSVQRELQGGIGLVEMLFRCNLMALVGGGPSPQAPPHRVVSFCVVVSAGWFLYSYKIVLLIISKLSLNSLFLLRYFQLIWDGKSIR